MSVEAAAHAEGDNLLMRISTEMVRAQKRFFGKGVDRLEAVDCDARVTTDVTADAERFRVIGP